jgi:RNA polymerase sigma-70 factor (ECF subfamily)
MKPVQADHLKVLWDRYCCRLLAFIRGRITDDAEAEDILQEVLIRIHRNLCCLREWSRMESWIYRITRNLIIDHYRKRKARVGIPDDIEAAESPPLEEDAETRLAFSLRESVDELPEPYRQALVLSDYEGLSQKELAARMGISLSGAKSRVQRARRKLKDMLLACCHFELDRRGKVIDYYPRCCGCNPADPRRLAHAR